jgi:hypothetical protein
MTDDIGVKAWTTCAIAADGGHVRLHFTDIFGQEASLTLPTDSVHQLLMTLPELLSKALRAQVGDSSVRAVFPLARWRLERETDSDAYIITLSTPDGFEVAFSLTARDLTQMGSSFEDLPSRLDSKRALLASSG